MDWFFWCFFWGGIVFEIFWFFAKLVYGKMVYGLIVVILGSDFGIMGPKCRFSVDYYVLSVLDSIDSSGF